MPDAAPLDPARTILLLMDLQPGIVGRIEGGEDVVAAAERAIQLARGTGAHVGYVRVGFTPEEVEAMPAHAPFRARVPDDPEARKYMHPDAPTTQVHERLAPQQGDLVARKPRVGAFTAPEFEPGLRERGVDTLVLAGLASSGVILSTLRDAADRDYRLLVLSDATADRDPVVYDVLTHKVFPTQADVVTVEQFGELLG